MLDPLPRPVFEGERLTLYERPLAEASDGNPNRVAPFVAAGRETLAASRFERDHAAAAVGLNLATAQEHRS